MTRQPLRSATPEDITYVCANLRPADRAECLAATGLPPEIVLPTSAATTGALSMVASSGEIVGLCGVQGSAIEGFGLVWMCATPSVTKHRVELIHHARAWLDLLHQHYPRLGNYVDARNILHIKWLKLLGFKLTGCAILGPESIPFITFERSISV